MAQSEKHLLLLVTGRDRPGILAAVTQILYIGGCNLEDVSVSHVSGEFALLVRFAGPSTLTADGVDKSFDRLRREMGLEFRVSELSPKEAKPPRKKPRMALISVHGPERPGLLFRLSSALAKLRVNLTEVSTHRMAESRHRPGAVLFLEAELPAQLDGDVLKKRLAALGKEMGLSIAVKPVRAGG